MKSIKEFIIDKGIFGDVPFDADIGQIFQDESADDHGDEYSHEDAFSDDVPDVDHVDSVHQKLRKKKNIK